MTSYGGFLSADIKVQHSSVIDGSRDSHGNIALAYQDPVERRVVTIYPLHRLPHHDVVSSDYVGRVMIDFIMEVPDASVYKKNDKVVIEPGGSSENFGGLTFLVQGFPFNWGDTNPFGFDKSMFGGSVHVERVT